VYQVGNNKKVMFLIVDSTITFLSAMHIRVVDPLPYHIWHPQFMWSIRYSIEADT
jgi:hypothetical protein